MEERDPKDPDKWKPLRSYAKYSTMGFQMIVIIGGLTWLGVKMDEWLSVNGPVFTIILALLSIGISFYLIFKQIQS